MKTQDPPQNGGFDATVTKRNDDHLNRWAFAREVVNVATKGPYDWTVRVGIYGEWGSGKSSVLRLAKDIATAEGHVVIDFNPWHYQNSDMLWAGFVTSIEDGFQQRGQKTPWSGSRAAKRLVRRAAPVRELAEMADQCGVPAAKGVAAGLGVLQECFGYGKRDLVDFGKLLDGKRLVILIDDLDRTSPTLVPEILFALEAIMDDQPGFSFLCAFDPLVVGKVLGSHHPGFEDGLRFLEKIVDYPLWLPKASREGLLKVAMADARRFCPIVPASEIHAALAFLPPNPRAVRQFIRILATLDHQIRRFDSGELSWSVIIASTVLRVRYPSLASRLLGDASFTTWLFDDLIELMKDDWRDQAAETITRKLGEVSKDLGLSLDQEEETRARDALLAIRGGLESRMRANDDRTRVASQARLLDAPVLLTDKEYNRLAKLVGNQPTPEAIQDWIRRHSEEMRFDERSVFAEALVRCVRHFAWQLNEAEWRIGEDSAAAARREADAAFGILECFLRPENPMLPWLHDLDSDHLRALLKGIAAMADGDRPWHAMRWPRTRDLVVSVAQGWKGSLDVLLNTIEPGSQSPAWRGNPSGPNGEDLQRRLKTVVEPRYAKAQADRFRELGYLKAIMASPDRQFAMQLLRDPDSAFWANPESGIFKVLAEARSNHSIQENACQFVQWLVAFKRGTNTKIPDLDELLRRQNIVLAIWNAATSQQLSEIAIGWTEQFPDVMRGYGLDLPLPPWWPSQRTMIAYPQTRPSQEVVGTPQPMAGA